MLLPTGRKLHTFTDRGVRRPGVLLGSTESLALPRTFPQLTDVANYLGWFGKASYADAFCLVRAPGCCSCRCSAGG